VRIRNLQISFWGSIATILLCPLFIQLGFWQLDRAGEKLALQQQFEIQSQADPVYLGGQALNALQSISVSMDLNWRNGILTGRYVADKQILLDNQHSNGQVGYFVYTLFHIKNSTENMFIWVNRGWTALLTDRTQIPDILIDTAEQTLTGLFAPPPSIGMTLGDFALESLNATTWRVQVMDLAKIKQQFSQANGQYVFNLQDAKTTPFKPLDRIPGSGVDKHYGYAFQWFAFAVAVLILYATQGLRRRPISISSED
jgi:cytochrome oxidase assembly protein ShyY1